MIFQEFSKPRLGNAEVRCFERPPNLFAVRIRSGIVAARSLMPDEIRQPSSLPRLRCFALFHSPTVELDRRTSNKNLLDADVFLEGNAGIAQLVEQRICNPKVIGSSPIACSLYKSSAFAYRYKSALATFWPLFPSILPKSPRPDCREYHRLQPAASGPVDLIRNRACAVAQNCRHFAFGTRSGVNLST